jgi:hypothetical protein
MDGASFLFVFMVFTIGRQYDGLMTGFTVSQPALDAPADHCRYGRA